MPLDEALPQKEGLESFKWVVMEFVSMVKKDFEGAAKAGRV